MASHRARPKTLLALGAALAVTLTLLPIASSQAEAKPTLKQVQQRIDALNEKIGIADEDYAGSRLDLAAARRKSSVALARLKNAQGDLATVQHSMLAFAAAAYRSQGTDQFVMLVTTSSPQTFLDRASSLNRIAAGQSQQLAAAATARHRLNVAQAQASAEQVAQAKIAQRMAKQKATIEEALATQQQLFDGLKADEKRRRIQGVSATPR